MNFYNDYNGQISIEFILLISFSLILVMTIATVFYHENELNIAMAAARNGATEGEVISSIAIYPKTSFNDYLVDKQLLTYPRSVKIIKVERINNGYHSTYNKTRIQLRIYASSPSLKRSADKSSVGDRINFNARKSIAIAFNTNHLSNSLYNPSFSNNYVFTTVDVRWV